MLEKGMPALRTELGEAKSERMKLRGKLESRDAVIADLKVKLEFGKSHFASALSTSKVCAAMSRF